MQAIRDICALIFLFLFSTFGLGNLHAQPGTEPQQNPVQEIDPAIKDYIENLVEESDAEFDFNEILDRLENYNRKPLDLNKASAAELAELFLLSPIQIGSLLQYRAQVGDLITIYELQAVPDFDLITIYRILPYVAVNKDIRTFQVPFTKMLYQGRNEIYLRWTRALELSRGYSPANDTTPPAYEGDPNKYYVRFKHSYENRHSWGFTLEKDAGESFFSGSNKQGFDFYSFHLYYRNLSPLLKGLVIGDYEVHMGQGLILSSGFSAGKSSDVANIQSSGRTLKPYTSVNESLFLRGAAAQIGIGENFNLTGFVSLRERDANVVLTDTLDNFEEIIAFSSLQESGLHRTTSELADEGAIKQFTSGGRFNWEKGANHIGINGVFTSFDADLNRRQEPYNQFFFNSGELLNVSLDYSFLIRNITLFGETALSDNGGLATINGLLLGLDRKIDLAILYRNLAKDFQSLYGNAFAESSSGNNESGLYLGLNIKPAYGWNISAYFDTWKHPWLRFRVDAPSKGFEYLIQVEYQIRRKLEIYFRIKNEYKDINAPDNTTNIDYLTRARKTNVRFHINNKLGKVLELRNRLELVFYDDGVRPVSRGFMIFQDIIYKPIRFPLSFTGRFAIFDTDTYDSRIYAYENDVLGSFSIPAYAYRGMRYYLNLRYKGIRNLTAELRFAQTYLNNRDGFGSSFDLIQGRVRSEVKAQLKYTF